MRRLTAGLLLAVLVLGIGLSGCGRSKAPVEGLPMAQILCGIKAPQGYFFTCLGDSIDDVFVCSIPLGQRTPVPVCKKAGCSHDSPDCDSYIVGKWGDSGSVGNSNLGYFRDRVYFCSAVDSGFTLCSIDPTTWERRQELVLPEGPMEAAPWGVRVRCLFHENYLVLLYSYKAPSGEELPTDINRQYIYIVDLPTLEARSSFKTFLDTHIPSGWKDNPDGEPDIYASVYSFRYAEGSKLYADGIYPYYEKQFGREQAVFRNCVFELDLDTGKVTEATGYPASYAYVEDGTLYYVEDKPDELKLIDGIEMYVPSSQEDGAFKERDIKTGKERTIPHKMIGTRIAVYLDDLIIVECVPAYHASWDVDVLAETEYHFFTRDYQAIDVLKTADLDLRLVTDDCLYFRNWERKTDYYLDLNRIGSGNLELTPVE